MKSQGAGTRSQWDHACYTDRERIWCHPPNNYSFKIERVTSYFEVRKTTQEEYEDQNILNIKLIMETPPWDLTSSDYSQQEQSMLDYRGRFVSPNTPATGQLFINSVTLYAYDDVMDDDNYVTVLDSYITTSAL